MIFYAAVTQISPVMVRVVDAPTKELSIVDVIIGGLGLSGLILLGAVLFGIALGGAFIFLKHRLPDNSLNGEASRTRGLQLTPPSNVVDGRR